MIIRRTIFGAFSALFLITLINTTSVNANPAVTFVRGLGYALGSDSIGRDPGEVTPPATIEEAAIDFINRSSDAYKEHHERSIGGSPIDDGLEPEPIYDSEPALPPHSIDQPIP